MEVGGNCGSPLVVRIGFLGGRGEKGDLCFCVRERGWCGVCSRAWVVQIVG